MQHNVYTIMRRLICKNSEQKMFSQVVELGGIIGNRVRDCQEKSTVKWVDFTFSSIIRGSKPSISVGRAGY